MEAPPSVVIPEAAMSQLAVVKKSLHVAVKKSLHVVVKKSLHVVVKSLLAVAKPTAATPAAIVLAAKIVDADSWRNFSLRRAAAMDASQLAVAKKSQLAAVKKSQLAAVKKSQLAVVKKSQLVVAKKSQLAVAKPMLAIQVATVVVLL